jgi:hypothetical protein
MSTAATEFLSRKKFFPFCASQADPSGIPFLAQYDSVVFHVTSGDAGLAEAMRFFWMIEQVTFTPTGTVTNTSSPFNSISFSKTYTAPLPATADLSNYLVSGSVLGLRRSDPTSSDTALASVEPVYRACSDNLVHRFDMQYSVVSSISTYERGFFDIVVAYTGIDWRLYYRFYFFDETITLRIRNPAFSSGGVVTSGTVSLGGLTLAWDGETPGGTYVASGYGLTASSVFWSF